jgi:hypothetical protein
MTNDEMAGQSAKESGTGLQPVRAGALDKRSQNVIYATDLIRGSGVA